MKDESVKIARFQIEFFREAAEDFMSSSLKYPEGDSFRSIYRSQASIYDGCQMAYEVLLLLEDVEVPRPFSRKLELMMESIKREAVEKLRLKRRKKRYQPLENQV